jgi:hypothetical protein
MDLFDRLLAQARATNDLQERHPDQERLALEAGDQLTTDVVLESLGSLSAISDRAVELIVVFEVGGQHAYETRYRHPIWPRGRSGITCGIGYDVGFVTPAALASDWHGNTSDANITLLSRACGVTGQAAAALVAPMAAVDIPFANAMAVFRDTSLRQTIARTVHALPNADKLHPDSLGALVSLVYNRGASFSLAGDRYAEMRQIRADVAASRFTLVPGRLRGMKRLWAHEPDSRGLLTRRELEAVLFEAGLGHM